MRSHRDERGVEALMELARDVRYSSRALARTPAFTMSAVLVLALGIGASAAIFSAVNAVLVAGLPYPQDERLVRIYNTNSATSRWSLSVVDYQAARDQSRSFSDVGALVVRDVPVAAGSVEPTETRTAPATAGFFAALGVRAARGRVLLPGDERESGARVAVVSDAYAVRAFGGAAAAMDRIVQIDGSPVTIVGVLSPGVHDLAGIRSEIWPNYQPAAPTRRGPFGLAVVARLRDGVTLAQARSELAAVSERIFPVWSNGFKDRTARITPVSLREAIIGSDAPRTLWLFVAAAALLLLTAVANVASLMLARMAARARELSLRAVLGASRLRLGRLVVTETTVLSAFGALLGLAAAKVILRVLVMIAPNMPRLDAAVIDWRVVLYAAGGALFVGIIVGLYPVISLVRESGDGAYTSGQREVG